MLRIKLDSLSGAKGAKQLEILMKSKKILILLLLEMISKKKEVDQKKCHLPMIELILLKNHLKNCRIQCSICKNLHQKEEGDHQKQL